MSSDPENHWSATAHHLTIGPFPATSFIPIPVLPFYHPLWLMVAVAVWFGLNYLLMRKGLGLTGLAVIWRRWLQGRSLPPRPYTPPSNDS